MNTKTQYDTIIGLEVHVQLSTKSKAYCADANLFGEPPNKCISPISLGYPGTLPKPNKKVIHSAIKLGLALNCNITEHNIYARKNYFYPDLPKGYQITQDKTPICTGGYVEIDISESSSKKIALTRIHMEEDAGKSIHDLDPFHSLIDFNRAGVALLEIVSEPEIKSPQEAYLYLQEIRKLVRYLGISNGNMEEGSLRCDANISVRPTNETKLRNRVEVKNINSFKNVMKAIDLEVNRQIKCYNAEKPVHQETRNYNAANNTTTVLRSKEEAHDYRYFPEPDIMPINLDSNFIKEIKKEMPILPKEQYLIFTNKYKLSHYDAKLITEDKGFSDLFNLIIKHTQHYKTVVNILMGIVKSYLNDNSFTVHELNIKADHIAELANMIENKKISHTIVAQKLFPAMIKNNQEHPSIIATKNGWLQKNDTKLIKELVEQVIKKNPEKRNQFKEGKTNLIGFFMGEIMRETKGKINPKLINEILKNKLSE